MKSKICVALAAENHSEMIEQIGRAEDLGADLIEVRFDFMYEVGDVRDLVTSSSLPLIATNRLKEQGGKREIKEEERVRVLLDAAEGGFDYVDLELTMPSLSSTVKQVKELGAKVIISYHNFEETPPLSSLKETIDRMVRAGADICKLITMAKRVSDNITCFNLIREELSRTRIVCFAMSELGVLSRVLSPIIGSEFTYASIRPKRETAPGQLTIQELREIYSSIGLE